MSGDGVKDCTELVSLSNSAAFVIRDDAGVYGWRTAPRMIRGREYYLMWTADEPGFFGVSCDYPELYAQGMTRAEAFRRIVELVEEEIEGEGSG